ncbi:MAG: FG-GAP repeat domain-containing protein, partial [Phycisphaerales bacterium JB040]
MNGIVLSACAGMMVGTTARAEEPTTGILFEERAFSAGILFKHVQLSGRPWAVYGTGGVAGDFNNDGWADLFVLGGGDTRDALFINKGINPATGRVWFQDQSSAWGVRLQHYGYAASAADYDNDGDLDLYVTSYGDPASGERNGQHKLYRNDLLPDGSRVFTNVAEQAGVHLMLPGEVVGMGSAWGDPDLDGDLDLFVSGYPQDLAANRMFRNNSDGTFTDVTTAWGLNFTGVSGFVPGFVDMSRNGRPDLLLVADTGTSCYFVNRGVNELGVPDFADRTGLVDDLTTANGMGSAVGDLNK